VAFSEKEDDMNRKRKEQLSSVLEEYVANLFVKKISDPRLTKVNVTRTKVSEDLKSLTIFYSILGQSCPDGAPKETIKALTNATGFIRSKLAADLNLRATPKIRFVFDKNPDHAQRIIEILETVTKDGFLLVDSEEETEGDFRGLANPSKDLSQDSPKDLSQDNPKDLLQDNPKDLSQDNPKDLSIDSPKDYPKDACSLVLKEQKGEGSQVSMDSGGEAFTCSKQKGPDGEGNEEAR
jgi:ribosome-binding factor A